MRGCLTLPFRLLLLALLALGGYLAWTRRAEIRRLVHRWTAEAPAAPGPGRADPALVPEVRRRLAGLGNGTALRDTVVLSSAELASVVASAIDQRAPGAVDSLTVRLGRDEVKLRALVNTRRVPIALGPAAAMLRDREWVEADGRLFFRRPGLAEWQVGQVRVRGVPIPANFVAGLLRQLGGPPGSGEGGNGTGAVALPAGIGGFRVDPGGLLVYGPNPLPRGKG